MSVGVKLFIMIERKLYLKQLINFKDKKVITGNQ